MVLRFLIISSLLFASSYGFANKLQAPASVVVAIDDKPKVKVYSYGVELIVMPESGEYNFRIYSITGQVVKSLKLSEGSEIIELPQGCYIIKCEAWSKKVVIR